MDMRIQLRDTPSEIFFLNDTPIDPKQQQHPSSYASYRTVCIGFLMQAVYDYIYFPIMHVL